MNTDKYWLSRIIPHHSISWRDLVKLNGLDPYGQHQMLWKLFDLPPKEQRPEKRTPFLFRAEKIDRNSLIGRTYPHLSGLPLFYVLSTHIPYDPENMWRIDTPQNGYQPDVREGDRLFFTLRANPTIVQKVERMETSEQQTWLEHRRMLGLKEKPAGTKKRIRHDVIMDAKRRNREEISSGPNSRLSEVAYEAGSHWLKTKAEKHGFHIEGPAIMRDEFIHDVVELPTLYVDGYSHWRQRHKNPIQISMIDFTGTLLVTDPTLFCSALFRGIGPAKGFGCGLLLVRR